ncbi:MAG: hypothetical protein Q8R28_02645, partial [Dehalococcoidia bacterium]|nr:hypothetical protein [Dehalococcoidia bacterium]
MMPRGRNSTFTWAGWGAQPTNKRLPWPEATPPGACPANGCGTAEAVANGVAGGLLAVSGLTVAPGVGVDAAWEVAVGAGSVFIAAVGWGAGGGVGVDAGEGAGVGCGAAGTVAVGAGAGVGVAVGAGAGVGAAVGAG